LEVDKYGIFITVCQRNINTNANETGGVISGEQPRKYITVKQHLNPSQVTSTLPNL
jgi:hypothetical protein